MEQLMNMKVLYRIEDFNQSNTFEELILSSVVVFIVLWLIEWTSYAIYSLIGGEIFATKRNKTILARHTMDFVSMAVFSYIGIAALSELGYDVYATFKNADGKVLAAGAERIYEYLPSAQRLILFHIAYETKNFCDSLIHNDGIVFLIHHICTLILCVFALNPLVHVYTLFFLGMSEISTSFLCVLVCFDADHGVAALGKRFPTLMKLLGVLFAICFIVFRCIIWPYVSYSFFMDSFHVLEHKTAHSEIVIYIYLIFNMGFNFLQVLWLSEIIVTAKKLLFSKDGENFSIARGDTKKGN